MPKNFNRMLDKIKNKKKGNRIKSFEKDVL